MWRNAGVAVLYVVAGGSPLNQCSIFIYIVALVSHKIITEGWQGNQGNQPGGNAIIFYSIIIYKRTIKNIKN